jgi:hypothetical protein
MSFDFLQAAALTKAALKSDASVTDGMGQLLDFCAVSAPNPAWDIIRKLDFEYDLGKLRAWLAGVLSQEPPAPAINAYWFGLFNPIFSNKQPTCGLYISGSSRFTPEDEANQWACMAKGSYLPKNRYAQSDILTKIYEVVNANGVGDIGEYVLCLGYACIAIKLVCAAVSPKLLYGQHESRAIAVGFDSGDFIVIQSPE